MSKYYKFDETHIKHTYKFIIKTLSTGEFVEPNYKAAQRNDIYARGVGVHSDNRDEKTARAVNILIKSWNVKDKEVFEPYYDEFVDYFSRLKSPQKDYVIAVLGKNPETGEEYKRKSSDFGGLLTANRISAGGTMIDPKELIARFWHFAETYEDDSLKGKSKEEQERLRKLETEDIKNGLLGGLARSYNIDHTDEDIEIARKVNNVILAKGHVVCDPGKLQNMAVSTITGRLKDENGKYVHIDSFDVTKEEEEEEMTTVYNLEDITTYLSPFINFTMYDEEMRAENVEQFYEKLFEYLYNLSQGNVLTFSATNLDPPAVVYYTIMMTGTGKDVEINPNLSLTDVFEDMFDISPYLQKYEASERQAWNEAHPEQVKAKEEARKKAQALQERARKVRERQERHRKYRETGRTPSSPTYRSPDL